MQKRRENLLKFWLMLTLAIGLYLIVAWASYSPLDNSWSVASSATQSVLNKTGVVGAVVIDFLLAMLGYTTAVMLFTLTFSAAYLLLLKQTAQPDRKQIILWLVGLVLFVFGLSGLFSVLLENNAYYLSGGFLGGMLNQWLEDSLGQVAVLLVAMFCTSVGFYFCSGQILIQLFNRLYHWIFDAKHEATEQEDESDLHNMVNTTPLVQPEFLKEAEIKIVEAANEQDAESVQSAGSAPSIMVSDRFTEITDFPRPTLNITGLRKPEHPLEPNGPKDIAQHTADAFFPTVNIESTPLPKINVPQQTEIAVPQRPIEPSDNSSQDPEMSFSLDETPAIMPKVRLNPVDLQQVSGFSGKESSTAEDSVKNLSLEEADNENGDEIPFSSTEISHIAPLAQELPTPPQRSEQESSKQVHYPKGYGQQLIHPLLQQKTVLEKPTTPLPTLDLLEKNPSTVPQISEQEILETSAKIEKELANFGVKATVEDVLLGPVVTRYEIKPAPGVKAAKITSLDSDLARALIFKAIRITDFVPGKPHMGIETPNKHRETVWLRDVLASDAFQYSRATLPMALGKDISGEAVVVDMAKMPHLLVAGQTGGGKSVGVNSMILSLLYKLTPEEVRFIMIDPKVVELSIYNDIPHLLTPVVTDMKKAENALRWAVEEMERRYLLVSSLSVRSIEGYNDKIRQAEEMGYPIPNTLWRPGDTMDTLPPPLEKMSYIVLIVDEFADLMMTAGKQVEDHIMRIAQKARAVGIHLILATQRPSTDVITGVIKANIPSRIAFTVASQIDSRTILDKTGAESLLGRGDMLYSGSGSSEIIRVHGAFMSDEDVQRVADNWRARGKPEYINSITEPTTDEENSGNSERSGELDPLFDEIAQYMIEGGATSISAIQRRFSLGFNRAGRIIDQLEEEGILSAPDSRGKREVLAR